jgi:orotidine-5'-phosphate decarboxylase
MLYQSEFLDDTYFENTELISKNLEGAIERIDIREDCADFTACGLIRFYIENEHRLAQVNKDEIKNCLIGFKYWMDQYDGRADSMCHWSENHQILFATTEYLAGCTWPDSVFSDGKSGTEHTEMAKERIDAWMYQRYYYGFNEYYSNNYYPEDIAPMANFIQFAKAEDAEMVSKMKIIMDIIWLDIATQSYKYVDTNGDTQYAFVSASGRMYMDNKSGDDTGNRLRPYINLVLENGKPVYEYMGGLVEKWGESTIGKYGYSAVGAVVGATHPTEAARLREVLPHTFFLIPGYGAQGANAEMLKSCFGKNGLGGVVNNSRGILCAYQKLGGTYYEAARAACLTMQKDLSSVIGTMSK